MRASARRPRSAPPLEPGAGEGGGEARGRGIARGVLDTRLAQAPLLPLELLWIGGGTADGGDEDDLAPARGLPCRNDGRGEGAGGVGMRAIAQDHVEKDDEIGRATCRER